MLSINGYTATMKGYAAAIVVVFCLVLLNVPTDEHATAGIQQIAKESFRSGQAMIQSVSELTWTRKWKNKNNLVHVITTRFQPGETELLSLGKARIDQFRVFSLKSITSQTNSEFLLVISVDPDLHPDLIEQIARLVRGMPNVVVIETNDDPPSIRSKLFSRLTENRVITGNFELLQDYHRSSKERAVLQTQLDFDSTISVSFVENIQKEAAEALGAHVPSGYVVWCVGQHFAWVFYSKWPEFSKEGILEVFDEKDTCLRTGFTVGYTAAGIDPDRLARFEIDTIHEKVEKCGSTEQMNCTKWINEGDFAVAAMQVRSPMTSAQSKSLVNLGKELVKSSSEMDLMHVQPELWQLVSDVFRVRVASVKDFRSRVEPDMADVLADVLEGHCSHGHSCSTRDEENILKIQEEYGDNDDIASSADDAASGNKVITEWTNPYQIVHVITTRYQQTQPDLIHLGKARMEQFRAFTLPSMRKQTSKNFLWIIFTDPLLHRVLRDELLFLTKEFPNVVILGSNEPPPHFRSKYYRAIDKSTVISGSFDLLQSYFKASHSHVLLETRLDADDAVFIGFVEFLQQQAVFELGARNQQDFRVWCAERHMVWGYYNPWVEASHEGYIMGFTDTEFCVTAGLTIGYGIETSFDDLPTHLHDRIHREIPRCIGGKNNCLQRIAAGSYKYSALRSRAPSSAGMKDVIPSKSVLRSVWQEVQEEAWNEITDVFGSSRATILEMRLRFATNIDIILEEALQGQCTRGHSCKESSRNTLKSLMAEIEIDKDSLRWRNMHNFVHTIETRFMQHQPNLEKLGMARLHEFRAFTLPSMLHQSTTGFLWLIYVDPELDKKVRKGLIGALKEMPNAIVVATREEPKSIRSEWFSDVDKSTIIAGSLELLLDYHAAALTRVVLKTSLDADDSLYVDFVMEIQNQVDRELEMGADFGHRVWCGEQSMEWRYIDPWEHKSNKGALVGLEKTEKCDAAGLTVAYSQTTDPETVKLTPTKLHESLPPCVGKSVVPCLARIDAGGVSFIALRSRTPTSLRWENVVPDAETVGSKWGDLQELAWDVAKEVFNIDEEVVVELHEDLESNMIAIIDDALKGRCSPGAPCDNETKEKLKDLKAHLIGLKTEVLDEP